MARPEIETPTYLAALRRMILAAGRRVAGGDVDALPELVALGDTLDQAIDDAVTGLRAEPWQYSWAEIARRTGTSRQAAQQRWGTP